MAGRYFSRATFEFLRELERNNDKAWWESNKDRYASAVREPALDLIADMAPRLREISPHFTAAAKTNGGSLMRPYRDVRFSKDKTPYKTNVGIQFRHEQGKDVHAPGFYLHLEPAASFAGAGMWGPEAKVARKVREAIDLDPGGWASAARSQPFTDVWELDRGDGATLKRVPKELSDDHPYPEDQRLKSFTAGSKLTQADATSDDLDEELARRYAAASGFTRFLCDSLGLPF